MVAALTTTPRLDPATPVGIATASRQRRGVLHGLIAAEAIERLQRRDKNRPVFLYVAFNAPHPPAQAPERLIQKYQRLGLLAVA